MKFRFRVLAALFALVAFTLTVAEGVWASTCMPNMPAIASDAPEAPGVCEMASTDAPADGLPDPDSKVPAPPHCPFTPLGASGSCATIASLPASSSADLAPSPEGSLLVAAPDQTRDLLLVSVLFHPPRV